MAKEINLKDIKKENSSVTSIDLPEGWSTIKTHKLGPFITKAVFRHPTGVMVHWSSRDHRKHHNILDSKTGSTWWAPKAVGWWIGVLFAVGALFFATATFPEYTRSVGFSNDGSTFFIGSIFFTTAALLQYLETVNARKTPKGIITNQKIRIFSWEPMRIDWVACIVQLIGTVFFNFSTYFSINYNMTVQQINQYIWTPDAYGSICFLIASILVWIEVGHSIFSWKINSISWQIAVLNLLGSIAFGVSAVSAFMVPLTGRPLNFLLVNIGTFIGGVCFFVGAVLLLPERTNPE